jgi:hypothetical protein
MNDTQIQDKAAQYQGIFEQIRRKVSDLPLALVILQEIGKDIRQERIGAREHANGNGNGGSNGNGDSPASEKQLAYLEKLGVPIPAKLTKREASKLIDEAVGTSEVSGEEQSSELPRWPRRIP